MATDDAAPQKEPVPPPAPARIWRLVLAGVVIGLWLLAYVLGDTLGLRGKAALGVLCFFGVAAVFSKNLRALNWRTIAGGLALQVFLAWFVIRFEVFGHRPGYETFSALAEVARQFLAFSNSGSSFVFGDAMKIGPFAFAVLPTIIFVSSFFAVLYHFGVLQWVVRGMAWLMMKLLRTSGAETLSVSANVFVGQTEAPLIVKPYVTTMTESELLTLMVGGMAHISGGLMAVYIGMGADAVAILATSVMAAPCSLYLSKVILPELSKPETLGSVRAAPTEKHANVIDAAAAGAADGVRLAINIAGMLIAFLAFIALADAVLDQSCIGFNKVLEWFSIPYALEKPLSLQVIFSWVFQPVAYLLGIASDDVPKVADLLGTKLVLNEFVAYTRLTTEYAGALNPRSATLAAYALTGFANFASIGIQLGGIGGIAPKRRADLARLGPRALLTGYLVTLINASIASLFLAS